MEAFDAIHMDADDSADYTISNPDTLTKYKNAAQITHKVLETVTGNNMSMFSSFTMGFDHVTRLVCRGRKNIVNM